MDVLHEEKPVCWGIRYRVECPEGGGEGRNAWQRGHFEDVEVLSKQNSSLRFNVINGTNSKVQRYKNNTAYCEPHKA